MAGVTVDGAAVVAGAVVEGVVGGAEVVGRDVSGLVVSGLAVDEDGAAVVSGMVDGTGAAEVSGLVVEGAVLAGIALQPLLSVEQVCETSRQHVHSVHISMCFAQQQVEPNEQDVLEEPHFTGAEVVGGDDVTGGLVSGLVVSEKGTAAAVAAMQRTRRRPSDGDCVGLTMGIRCAKVRYCPSSRMAVSLCSLKRASQDQIARATQAQRSTQLCCPEWRGRFRPSARSAHAQSGTATEADPPVTGSARVVARRAQQRVAMASQRPPRMKSRTIKRYLCPHKDFFTEKTNVPNPHPHPQIGLIPIQRSLIPPLFWSLYIQKNGSILMGA